MAITLSNQKNMPSHLSYYLDAVRFFSAFMVFLYHIKTISLGPTSVLRFIPDKGHFFVILFFVLSGYVIAYSTYFKNKGAFSYAVDRFTRVFSVALPSLVLCCLFAFFYSVSFKGELTTLLANVLFLGQAGTLELYPFWNQPYWSLCYEVMYYILFGCFFFLNGWTRITAITVACIVSGPKVMLLLPCWLFGVWIYNYRDAVKVNKYIAISLSIILPAVIILILVKFNFIYVLKESSVSVLGIFYDKAGFSSHFLVDYVTAVMFSAHVYFLRFFEFEWYGFLKSLIKIGSKMSFTLYLFHLPLLKFQEVILGQYSQSKISFLIALFVIPIICYLLSIFTDNFQSKLKLYLRNFSEREVKSI